MSQDDTNPYFAVFYRRQGQVVTRLLGFHNPSLVVMSIVGADPQAKPLCWNAISQSHIYENSYKHAASVRLFSRSWWRTSLSATEQCKTRGFESGCICFVAPAVGCHSSSHIWLKSTLCCQWFSCKALTKPVTHMWRFIGFMVMVLFLWETSPVIPVD